YELNINYIKPLHNKVIAVIISNKIQIWQFNAQSIQNNSLSLDFIQNEDFNHELINLKIIIPLTTLGSLFDVKSDDFLSKVKIDGDIQLATNLSKLVQSLSIDLEDILSLNLPPTLAYLLAEFIKKQQLIIHHNVKSLAQHSSDYLMHEKKLVISKLEFEDLYTKTVQIRNDTDRVQQKFNKLIKLFFNQN
ncbi:MAG: hypothetical protein RLZZ210_1313, partial [Pseudomonadota bacterium]